MFHLLNPLFFPSTSNIVTFRLCSTGLPSDVIIEVGEMSFHLHKVHLTSSSLTFFLVSWFVICYRFHELETRVLKGMLHGSHFGRFEENVWSNHIAYHKFFSEVKCFIKLRLFFRWAFKLFNLFKLKPQIWQSKRKPSGLHVKSKKCHNGLLWMSVGFISSAVFGNVKFVWIDDWVLFFV